MLPVAASGANPLSIEDRKTAEFHLKIPNVLNVDADETSSLMSKSSMSIPGDVEEDRNKHDPAAHDLHIDIRGMAMLPKLEFWQLFFLLGSLTGIGLMTIKYVLPYQRITRDTNDYLQQYWERCAVLGTVLVVRTLTE